MQGDLSTLVSVLLWLQALLATGVFCAWASRIWGHWRVWLLGAPILLAVLWGVTAATFRLLPNLL